MTLKYTAIAVLALTLSACASKPSTPGKADAKSAAQSTTTKDEPVKPTYEEKVGAISVDEMSPKAKCPAENAWNGQDWKKIIPMANACVKAKNWQRVESIGSYLGIHASLTPWGAYYMSVAAGQRKDYPRAVWMMDLALKKAPNEGLFHYQLGRLHWEQDDDQGALKELKIASELNPALTDAHWVMGQIALQQGDMTAAEKLLQKALDNDSKHWPALMAMASLRAKEKNWEQAESLLSRALKINPKDAKARQALGQVQEQQAKAQAAKAPPKVSQTRKPTGEKKKVKE